MAKTASVDLALGKRERWYSSCIAAYLLINRGLFLRCHCDHQIVADIVVDALCDLIPLWSCSDGYVIQFRPEDLAISSKHYPTSGQRASLKANPESGFS